MSNEEDIRDMLAFQGGSEEAFHRLFQRHSRPIMNYLFRSVWNRAVAEEMTQEVFLRVCRAAKKYEPRTTFKTWLYQIATNVARNEASRRKHRGREEPMPMVRSPDRDDRPLERADPGGETPEGMALARSVEETVQRALAGLPERQATALILCRQQGFSYQEIGKIMGLRLGAVKSLVHRATETLRKVLADDLESSSDEGVAQCGA